LRITEYISNLVLHDRHCEEAHVSAQKVSKSWSKENLEHITVRKNQKSEIPRQRQESGQMSFDKIMEELNTTVSTARRHMSKKKNIRMAWKSTVGGKVNILGDNGKYLFLSLFVATALLLIILPPVFRFSSA
jgi:hypothetical protein